MNQNIVEHRRPDPVRIQFDWEFPTDNQAMFQLRIEREGRISRVDFELDLEALPASDLARLEDFLGRRHAGITSAPEVVQISAWLIDLSLGQGPSVLSRVERQAMVRALLLFQRADQPVCPPKRKLYGQE
jgi:hypothetical protein